MTEPPFAPVDPMLEVLLDVRAVFDPRSTIASALHSAVDDVRHGSAVAWVALPDPAGGLMIEDVLGERTEALGGLAVASGQGVTGRVFAQREIHWVNEYPGAGSITHDFDLIIEAERIRRMIAAPLTVDTVDLGVLSIGRRDDGEFGDVAVARVEALAKMVSTALGVQRASRTQAAAAAVAERRRIGEELHDGVSSMLFAMISRTDRLSRHVGPDLSHEIDDLQAQLTEVSSMVRMIVEQWHAAGSDDVLAEVKGIAQNFEHRSGIETTTVFLGSIPPVDNERMQAVSRFVGVALANVERHSQARRVTVTVSSLPGSVSIAIANDGPAPQGVVPGVGLNGAASRVERLGGQFTRIVEDDGAGFTVRAQIPW